MNKKNTIPRFKSDKEAATFWDSHDFSDYIKDTASADDVMFQRDQKETLSIRLGKNQVKEIKRIAHRVGLGHTSLIRSWVTERLARLHHA